MADVDAATATPLAEGLFTWPSDSPALIGTKCGSCGEVTFPSHYGCPRCASEDMTTIELGTHRHGVDVDHAELPSAAAVCRARGVRAVPRRLRRARPAR